MVQRRSAGQAFCSRKRKRSMIGSADSLGKRADEPIDRCDQGEVEEKVIPEVGVHPIEREKEMLVSCRP